MRRDAAAAWSRAGARRGSAGRPRLPRAAAPSQAPARGRPRRSCPRSRPIPRAPITSTTGTTAMSASQCHGSRRTRSEATRIPAATMPAVNRRGELRRQPHEHVDMCVVRRDGRGRHHDRRHRGEHDRGAPPSPDQQEEWEEEVELRLDRDRPERAVGARRAERGPGPGTRRRPRTSPVGSSVFGCATTHQATARLNARAAQYGGRIRHARLRANSRTLRSCHPDRAGAIESENPESTMKTTTAKCP